VQDFTDQHIIPLRVSMLQLFLKVPIWVMECDHRSLMQDYKKSNGGEAIWSTLSDTLFLGLLSSDNKSENRLSLNTCDTSVGDQHWKITTTLPSEDRCSKDFGNKKCSNNKCLSTYGWRGTTSDYCAKKKKKNFQTSFGKCDSK